MLTPINESGSKKVYLRIANGAIISKKDGVENRYGSVSGKITRIEVREHEFENKKFKNWHILLEDKYSGEEYDVAIAYKSGPFPAIIRSLVTEQGLANLNDITIEVYTSKNGFTNASVKAAGQRLHWIEEPMPAINIVKVGDEDIKDYTAQLNWLQTLVDKVNARAQSMQDASQEVPAVDEDDDLPAYE